MLGGADQQVVIELVAKVDKLEKGMAQAQRSSGASFKKMAIAAAAVTAAITGVIVVVKKLVKSFTDYALKIDKASKATGVAREELQKWGYIAEQEHGNFERIERAFLILSQRTIQASQGLATYTREFDEMGIEIRDATTGAIRPANEIFVEMGNYLKNTSNESEALGHVTNLLGARVSKDLIPMLKLSNEELDRLGKEAEELGIVLDTKTIKATKEFSDKVTKLKERFRGIGLEIAEKLIPAFEKILDGLDKGNVDIASFAESIGALANSLADFVAGEGANFLQFLTESAEGISVVMDFLSGVSVEEREYAKLDKMTLNEIIARREEVKALLAEQKEEVKSLHGMRKKQVKFEIEAGTRLLAIIREYERLRRSGKRTTGEIFGPFRPEDVEKEVGIGVGIGGAGVGGEGRPKWLPPGGKAPFRDAFMAVGAAAEAATVPIQVVTSRLGEWELALEEVGATAADFARGIGESFGNVLGEGIQVAMNGMIDKLKITLDEGASLFQKFGATVWNALLDLVNKIITSALINLAVQLIASLIPGGGAFVGVGTALLGGVKKALGFDNPHLDQWLIRDSQRIGDFIAQGLSRSMYPQLAMAGRPIVIRADGDWIKWYEERPESDKRRVGRTVRKAQAVDRRADV